LLDSLSPGELTDMLRRNRLSVQKRKEGWPQYLAAVEALHEGRSRPKCLALFKSIVTKYPDSDYAAESSELVERIGKMIREAEKWLEPRCPAHLSGRVRLEYNLHYLRDLACSQATFPGRCNVLSRFYTRRGTYNAAIDLYEMGSDAVDALVDILDDRRPTRSF